MLLICGFAMNPQRRRRSQKRTTCVDPRIANHSPAHLVAHTFSQRATCRLHSAGLAAAACGSSVEPAVATYREHIRRPAPPQVMREVSLDSGALVVRRSMSALGGDLEVQGFYLEGLIILDSCPWLKSWKQRND